MIHAMPRKPTSTPRSLASTEWLHKGLMLLFIGLAVLVGPVFMSPSALRDTVAASSPVGWFAVVLSGAFVLLHARRRLVDRRR